ncbi:MAG TPA: rhomboid family intramembrane serine protease [Xanthobacteraceae bacterium]|nr:rhomboid family intramembrane serine protease [Xanthobacteraceae bacterium]
MFPIRTSVPARNPALVTWILIAVNCAVFLFEIGLDPSDQESFFIRYALIPARYFAPEVHGLPAPSPVDYAPFFTNMFLHGGWLHLIVNMWTLWLFGPAVEDRLGSGRFLIFYLGCGMAASAAHALANATSVVPALGASGAIAGVMGCYLRLFPYARVIVLVPIVFVPLFFELHAVLYVGIWFVTQLLQGTAEIFSPAATGGVAWWAHVGGFIVGFVVGSILRPTLQRTRPYYPDQGVYGFTPHGHR